MLSILIPTYNYNIVDLVKKLHAQASDTGIKFEIVVMEDGSKSFVEENTAVVGLPFCRYIVLEDNVGRAVIRNKLASEARCSHLLFLDCDADIVHPDFVSRYVAFCHEKSVVLGGRIYDEKNKDPRYSLIKKYGTQRERNNLLNEKARLKHPMFTTPNFLIPADTFKQVKFNEIVEGYGHEDTIFGLELKKRNIPYYFIDNPVVHVGIEENKIFLDKTRKAIANLYDIYIGGQYPEITKESKLLHYFLLMKKWRLTGFIAFKYKINHKIFEQLLYCKNPSLLLFDLYKLFYLCALSKKK